MLNWIFLKKFILAGSVAGLSATPLILISKSSAWGRNQYFSEFKKRRGAYSLRFAERFGFDEFTREIFNVEHMKRPIEGVFAKDILGNYLRKTNSPYLRNKYQEFIRKEEKNFQRELADLTQKYQKGKPAINRILDENGGTREDMIRRKTNNDSYSFLKDEILEFDQKNFTLNKHYDSNKSNTSFIRSSHFFSKNELENSVNWPKIGFYPLVTRKIVENNSLEQFEKDKFDFINWAHKKWFEEVQPFYVWMSLWKYKENVTQSELETIWNKGSLGSDFPTKASYEFPYFESKDGAKLSTSSKFGKFVDNVIKNSSNSTKEDIYVPNLYTDDNGTSLYMEASNMYNGQWFVKFAAAANYKYQKALFSNNSNINGRDKSSATSSVKNGRLFDFFANTNTNTNTRSLKVDKNSIFKSNGNEKYSDAVEINDSPWIFIRNQAGIHAVAVDSATARNNQRTNKTLDDIYNHFNFRTLQVKEKQTFSLQKTLEIDYTKPINSFKEYISKNFDKLLVNYTISDNSKNNNLFRNYNLDTSYKYKKLFNQWEELIRIKAQYQKQIQLREALIKEYSRSHWETETEGKVPKKMGIASPLPYEMKKEKEGTLHYLFPQLEKIYNIYFSSNKYESIGSIEELKKKQNEFQKVVGETLGKLELNTKIDGYFQSDRIFLNNFYVNQIIDDFFKNEQLFRNLLLKNSLRDDYLGKSFIGNKGYVDTNKTKTLLIEGKGNKLDSAKFLDYDDNDESKISNLMGDIDTYVNKFYYGKYFLKNAENNIWDVLKYVEDENSLDRDKIQKSSKNAFEKDYFLNVDGLKEKHHKFLATLTYLTRNKFKNFLSLMQATVTPKNDAYFLWESLKKSDSKTTTKVSGSNLFENPWLNPNVRDFKKDVNNFYSSLMIHFSTYKSPVGVSNLANRENSFYKGFLVLDSSEAWVKKLVNDPSKLVSDTLYKYGKEGKEVDDYVQSIQNEADLDEVIEKIKKIANNSKPEELNLLNLKTVYISESESIKQYRILTLQERKSLVSAILNKIKTEDIKDNKLKKEQYKKIFKTDPDNNWKPEDTTRHTSCSDSSGCSNIVQDKHFKQKQGKIGDYHVTQVNNHVFKSFDNLKKFVHGNISRELFWAWIIDLAQSEKIQEMAIKDLEDTIDKVEAYDRQFQESASYRYAR